VWSDDVLDHAAHGEYADFERLLAMARFALDGLPPATVLARRLHTEAGWQADRAERDLAREARASRNYRRSSSTVLQNVRRNRSLRWKPPIRN